MKSSIRDVHGVLARRPTIEGAGVRLKRVFGFSEVPSLDPFLLLDDFGSDNPDDYVAGFPWHPHRGIETVTYMIRGEVEHGDSLGNSGVIRSGDVQWMTAGSGIIHQEMPKAVPGSMQGCQLWVNLPAARKLMPPRYRDVTHDQIPQVNPEEGVSMRIIAGEFNGTKGPVKDVVVAPTYLDVTLDPGKGLSLATPRGHTAFAYMLEGDMTPAPGAPHRLPVGNLVHYGDGASVEVIAGRQGARFLFLAGQPLGEPVAWYGPIVMNTQAELDTAFREYEDGTFIKHRK